MLVQKEYYNSNLCQQKKYITTKALNKHELVKPSAFSKTKKEKKEKKCTYFFI